MENKDLLPTFHHLMPTPSPLTRGRGLSFWRRPNRTGYQGSWFRLLGKHGYGSCWGSAVVPDSQQVHPGSRFGLRNLLTIPRYSEERNYPAPYGITYIWNLKHDTKMNWPMKQKQTPGHREHTCGCQAGWGREGWNESLG